MLKGKCALITGSTDGLGFAIAARLAAEGCNIVLNGFADAETVERRRRELKTDHQVQAVYHGADLRHPAEIEDLVDVATDTFGTLDILVNNAVVRHFAPVEKFPVERWNEALAVNLSAAFHTIRLALPGMRARNFGRIINMSSAYGHFATPNRIDYVTTKTALIGMTRAVAIETVGQNITCNALCPGAVHTPAIDTRVRALAEKEKLDEEQAVAKYLADRQPSGRFIAAESIAGLVAFLCGPYGRDITGAELPVDGGWTAS
jgi:3-hydroxybutyrate dehydrogenase